MVLVGVCCFGMSCFMSWCGVVRWGGRCGCLRMCIIGGRGGFRGEVVLEGCLGIVGRVFDGEVYLVIFFWLLEFVGWFFLFKMVDCFIFILKDCFGFCGIGYG